MLFRLNGVELSSSCCLVVKNGLTIVLMSNFSFELGEVNPFESHLVCVIFKQKAVDLGSNS